MSLNVLDSTVNTHSPDIQYNTELTYSSLQQIEIEDRDHLMKQNVFSSCLKRIRASTVTHHSDGIKTFQYEYLVCIHTTLL